VASSEFRRRFRSHLRGFQVPDDARSSAWVSFDGKSREQLQNGDSIQVSMSEYPMPSINKRDQTDDWFNSLVRCLRWNERQEQEPLPEFDEHSDSVWESGHF